MWQRSRVIIAAGLLACLIEVPTLLGNANPALVNPPELSADIVVADNATTHTVTMTVSDADGYDDLRDIRVLFNFTEAEGNDAHGRGYLAWGKADSDITRYGGTCILADAAGGGRWGYRADAWGGTTMITGLMWNTGHEVAARAADLSSGTCPSDFGPAVSVVTLDHIPLIPVKDGTPFHPGVRGQNPNRHFTQSAWDALWDLNIGSSGRGLAGGLDADTYDWRDLDSGANWGLRGEHFTTLQFLQAARDHACDPLLTTNVFGGGYQDPADGTFICQYDNAEGLATDWIRYTNMILQDYREGDETNLAGEDLRVYNSITNWWGRPRLLAPEETATPKVVYCEIGNEPELGELRPFLANHYLGPADYRDRYRDMSEAMLAVDAALKIGPCLMNPADPNGSGAWLDALAADPAIPIDFVGYHPYYSAIKANWGNPSAMTSALRDYKSYLDARSNGIHKAMKARGRTEYELMATEWNPLSWDAPSNQQRSVAMGLGIVEGVFTLAEEEVAAAHFWEQPQSKLSARDVFARLVDHMGDVLLANVEQLGLESKQLTWRIYASMHANQPGRVMIWGLNFNEDEVVSLNLALAPSRATSATLYRYGRPGDDASGGDTSLMHDSGMVWEQQDVSEGFDTRSFPFVMEDAEITLLVVDFVRVPPTDADRDGDTDLDDFGWFQGCLSGPSVQQTDPSCQDALLDPDGDVDQYDMTIFLGCLSGANVDADPDCAD